MNRPGMSPGLRLSLAYVVIAAVWIIASDRLVTLLVTDPDVRDVVQSIKGLFYICLLYTSPSPRDRTRSRMPSSA